MNMLDDMNTHSGSCLPPVQKIKERFFPREIIIDGQALTTTPAFDAYWYFAFARQDIFHSRFSERKISVIQLEDDILRNYRFTNAYRASDRVSQYLIREVIGNDDHDWSDENIFFRIMLFKIFNKIETWQALEEKFGSISLRKFEFSIFDNFLSERQDLEIRNYSAAYIMPSAGNVFGHKRKHSNHLALIQWMLDKKFPNRLKQLPSMKDGYELILSAPSLGPFLAFQFITDLNYSNLTDYSEMEFVVAGPGAHDGISKCFVGSDKVSAESIIAYMANHQIEYFDKFEYQFNDLWGRSLQLIDCQNLFCEISKYTRVAFPEIQGVSGRSRIKQKYNQNKEQLNKPQYPEKWGINILIDTQSRNDPNLHQRSQDYHSQKSLF